MSPPSHIKSTFKHTLIYSIATFLQKGAGFIMLPVYANYLGGEGYGIIGMIDVVISVLTVVVGYGLTGGMQRFYFERDTEQSKNKLISTAIIVTFFTVLVVCAPAYLFKGTIAELAFGKTGLDYYLVLAILTFFAEMTAQAAGGYLLIKQQSILFSLISTLKLVLALSLNIYFIVFLELGVMGFLYSGLISGVLYSLVLHVHAFGKVGLHFAKDDARALLRYNLPLIPGFVAMFFRNNADRIILRSFVGLAQVGTYNMLLKFSSLIALFILQPFLRIWAVKRYEICDQEGGAELMARVFTLQMALMLFVGLILSLEVPLVLKVMAPPEFWVSGNLAFGAVMAQVLFGAYYHLSFGLVYEKRTFTLSLIQIVSAAVSVVLNTVFIYYFGISGAVISAVLAFTFQCTVSYFVARKYYRIPFEWLKISQMFLVVCVLFVLINRFSVSIISLDVWINSYFVPLVTSLFEIFSLDQIRDGKLLLYLTSNLPVVVDGVIKLLLSFIFVVFLLIMGVITKAQILRPLNFFRAPFAFSNGKA